MSDVPLVQVARKRSCEYIMHYNIEIHACLAYLVQYLTVAMTRNQFTATQQLYFAVGTSVGKSSVKHMFAMMSIFLLDFDLAPRAHVQRAYVSTEHERKA